MSNKELADRLGVSAGNVSDWKSGRSKPSTDVVVKIARLFNVSTDYLLENTSGQQLDENFSMVLVENSIAELIPLLQKNPELQDLVKAASALSPEVNHQMTLMARSFLESEK